MSRKHKHQEGCDLDMTPMIDVVFQLIIFFIVTLTINKEMNKKIELEEAKNAPLVEDPRPETIVLEVDRTGRLSINNFTQTEPMLRRLIRGQYNRMGEFPVLIRADKRTPHRHVKKLLDICSESGIWRINFVAIKERVAK